MSWIPVTTLDSLPLREGRNVNLGDREIALFNLGDRIAAIDAACPHRGGPLCDGIVTGNGAPSLGIRPIEGHAVVCPLHGWKVDLTTGNVLKPDVSVRVETYEVRITDDGIVEVDVDALAQKEMAA